MDELGKKGGGCKKRGESKQSIYAWKDGGIDVLVPDPVAAYGIPATF
jgi:hypothetical protein